MPMSTTRKTSCGHTPRCVTLVAAAQADGSVRTDLTIDDFYLLLSNAPADQTPTAMERWVELILFGISGPPARG